MVQALPVRLIRMCIVCYRILDLSRSDNCMSLFVLWLLTATGRPEGTDGDPEGWNRGNGRFTSSRRCDHWDLVTGCSFSLAAAVVQLVTLS